MRITVIGGIGYTGSAIGAEAARRGHDVTSFSRVAPTDPVSGVDFQRGSRLSAAVRATVAADSEVVISSLSPRGDLDGKLSEVDLALATSAAGTGLRFGVVGGSSALRLVEGRPRIDEGNSIPPQFVEEGHQIVAILDALRQSGDAVDWFSVSPAANYGPYAPGPELGVFRVSGKVTLFDPDGKSEFSGPDFAAAIRNEIEKPHYRRARFGVAY
jgi:putative NADH-flavin reductase